MKVSSWKWKKQFMQCFCQSFHSIEKNYLFFSLLYINPPYLYRGKLEWEVFCRHFRIESIIWTELNRGALSRIKFEVKKRGFKLLPLWNSLLRTTSNDYLFHVQNFFPRLLIFDSRRFTFFCIHNDSKLSFFLQNATWCISIKLSRYASKK